MSSETQASNEKDDGFKLPKIVPSNVTLKAQKSREQQMVEKQREIMSKLIFPSHVISEKAHPNVSSYKELIRELELAAKDVKPESGEERLFTKGDFQKLSISGQTFEDIKNVKNKCDVFLRRSKIFEKQTKELNEQGADRSKIVEAASMSKIFNMNHSYCVATVSCPQRMAVLNHCFSRYSPDVVNALLKAGQHEYLCGKERSAVERCIGQKVQKTMSKILE